MRNTLDQFGIECLWYLAHIGNLASIMKRGILSRNQVKALCIDHERIDWTSVQRLRNRFFEWDGKIYHLRDFVPLFFSTHQPMLYVQEQRESVAHLKIRRDVLEEEGVFFTDGNCARLDEIKIYYYLEDLDKLNWEIMRTRKGYTREYKLHKAAEVLVPSPVPPGKILAIYVASKAKRKEIEVCLRSCMVQVAITVDPDLYEF